MPSRLPEGIRETFLRSSELRLRSCAKKEQLRKVHVGLIMKMRGGRWEVCVGWGGGVICLIQQRKSLLLLLLSNVCNGHHITVSGLVLQQAIILKNVTLFGI